MCNASKNSFMKHDELIDDPQIKFTPFHTLVNLVL